MNKVLFIALMLSSLGCSHITGATTLTPANTDPNQGAWVFIASDSAKYTGVYRCKEVKGPNDAEAKPVCVKAEW
jgi:hypothetical protein